MCSVRPTPTITLPKGIWRSLVGGMESSTRMFPGIGMTTSETPRVYTNTVVRLVKVTVAGKLQFGSVAATELRDTVTLVDPPTAMPPLDGLTVTHGWLTPAPQDRALV